MSQYTVLLLFKDDLSIGGTNDFPITIKSKTIQEHQNASKYEATYSGYLFSPEEYPKKILGKNETIDVNDGNFVWGWWKKPGESHNKIFSIIRDLCDKGEHVDALLWNSPDFADSSLSRFFC